MKGQMQQKGYALAGVLSRHPQSVTARLLALWQRVRRWHALAQQRRLLASLSDAALKDIGLSRADILEESERPFWDEPVER